MTPGPAPVRAYVALGANLDDPLAAVNAAFLDLAHLPDCTLVAESARYRTAPVGVGHQPDFINAVAALDTWLGPEELLATLLDLEARHGRIRTAPLAARTLDLDLLLYGAAKIHTPTLQLPHPRMHLRAFVLAPLAEVAPDLVLPGHGPIAALLPSVAHQAITRL
ncbi:MAG: 2-amino-4-hydroxy-6-hydroxymethyldihydropteridine diphosphokinase [Zoogloeaceae bacterium]|nr:2-amino-4-hydroxy-6-hydroxymethyldihydropteridine diphosphokinase [Zoogloeaceae bacterium]